MGNRRAFWRASRSTGEAVTLERRGAAKARTAVYFMLILMLWMVKESSAMVMAKMIIEANTNPASFFADVVYPVILQTNANKRYPTVCMAHP